jgi:hypothetical protein
MWRHARPTLNPNHWSTVTMNPAELETTMETMALAAALIVAAVSAAVLIAAAMLRSDNLKMDIRRQQLRDREDRQ